jgi:TP901 family phage tail tape measure protein
MAEGTILRKDIISDDALNWGIEYSKTLDAAIGKNKEFVTAIVSLADANNKLRGSFNAADFAENQKKINSANNEAIGIWKEQIQLENSLVSTKKKIELASEGTNRALVKERLELSLINKEIKQETLERLGLVSAYTKLNNARTEAKNKLRDLIASEQASTAEIKKASVEFEKLDSKVKKADQAVGDFSKNVGNYPLSNIASGLKNLISAFGVTGGIVAFASAMKGAYETVNTFEQGVADLSAITGATGKDLEYLKNQAIELGQETKGGASAVVEAYKLIASAKPELLNNVEALNQVTEATLLLAKAANMEMPAAATALTDAMNQFGAGAEEAQYYVDALANGAKYGSAEIPQLTEAVLKFGAVSKSSNINIKESVALVELLAENGLKGADAGTAIRNVLLKISAPDALPRRAREEMERLGISFDMLKDKTIPIADKLENLKPLLKDNASIVKIFGLENATAAINILSHTDRLKDLTSKMGEYGTANEQARVRMDTVQNKTGLMKSTYDSLILSIGTGKGVISDFFGTMIDGITGGLKDLIRLNTSWDELNLKAKGQGQKSGVKMFSEQFQNLQGTGSDADIAKSIKTVAERDYKVLQGAYKKNEKALKEFNPYAINISGPSGKDLKLEKERLIKEINEKAQIIREANKKISPTIKKPDSPVIPTGSTEEDKDAEKRRKAEAKALKEKLEREKKASDDLYNLEKQRLDRSIQLNNEVAKDDKEADDVRIAALEQSQSKQIELANLSKQHSLDADKFVLEKDKLNVSERTRIKEEAANKIVDIEKKTAEEIDKINQFDPKVYEANLKEGVSKLEIAMNEELAAEEEKFKSLGDLSKLNDRAKEKATKDHEQKIFDIKKEFAIATAKLQIVNLEAELEAFKQQSDGSKESNAIILETEKKISDAKLKLKQTEVDTFDKGEKKKVLSAKEQATLILEISSDMTGALTDLAGAFFEAKIQQIDDEITKNNEYYDKQLELAGNDERQKDLLNKEREKKNKELEDKKKKEQHKQAVFNKASALAQAAISTALAVLNALNTNPFLPLGPIMATVAGAMGAIQIGTILATPIPKYKHGRKGGKAEFAEVGDGYVSEVITKADGSSPRITPNKPTLTFLEQGDIVHKSVDDYNRYMRASILNKFTRDNEMVKGFQANNIYDSSYGKESLSVMKETLRAIKNQKKSTVVNLPKIDINYHLWRNNNLNWK